MRRVSSVLACARKALPLIGVSSLLLVPVVGAGCAESAPGDATDPASSSPLVRTPASFPATTATLDITLPPLSAADQATLVLGGKTILKLDDRVKTTGGTASGGPASTGTDGTAGSVTATGNAAVGDRTRVTGAVKAGGTATLGSGATAGTLQQHLALPATSLIHATVAIPAATQNITLATNEVASLPPGSYGQVTLNAGAHLTLAAGTYDFRGLDVEPSAQLIVSGSPVVVHVVTSFIFRGVIVDGNDATRLKLFYFGTAAVRLDKPLRGTFVAPNAAIVTASGAVTGFCYASSLEVSSDTTWTGIPSPLDGIAPPPMLKATGVTFSATQGVPFSGVVATFTDSNTTDTTSSFTSSIAWGDGTASAGVVGGGAGMFTVSGTHTYAKAGPFTVTVTITQIARAVTVTATSSAVVGNQLAASGVMFSATQGVVFTGLVATVTDANTTDTAASFTTLIAWGDGTMTTGVVGGGAGTFTVGGTHTYLTVGNFTVTVSITDTVSGATATATSTAHVGAELSASGVMFSATQGVPFTGTVASLTDANPGDPAAAFATTIAWGDGTTSTGVVTGSAGTFTIGGTHTYAAVGTFTVTVSITNSVSGATAAATSTAHVGAELSASGVTFTATTGVSFTGTVAHVTDANTSHAAASFTATIAWGDGATSAGVVTGGAGTFTISGTHTYTTSGTFTVTVSITNTATGATATATSTAAVGSALIAWGVTFTSSPGVLLPGVVVAHVIDTNPGAAGGLNGTIDWGDGSAPGAASFFSTAAGNFDVIGSHMFPSPGTFTVHVSVTDSSTGTTAGATSTAVVGPELSASGVTFTASPGVLLPNVVVAHLTDTNVTSGVAALTGTVDWGDGPITSPLFFVSTPAPGTFDIIANGGHTYLASGTFTVHVTVTDSSNGATASATSTAIVGPELSASGVTFTALPGVLVPGIVVGHLTDTNITFGGASLIGTVDWGDGTPSGSVFFVSTPAPGAFDIVATSGHTYAATGTFTIHITVTDSSNGATASATSTAIVGPELSASGVTFTALPGVLLPNVVVGHLSDTNTTTGGASLIGTIDWGDGTPSGSVFFGSTPVPGTFDLVANGGHTYASAGTFTVLVTVTDNTNGATTGATSTAIVGPELSASGVTFTAAPGVPLPNVVVGHLSDTKTTTGGASLIGTIDWGDGTPSGSVFFGSTPVPGTFDLVANGGHTYASAGTFTVLVTVTDNTNGAAASATSTATVIAPPGVAPQLVASGTIVNAAPGAPTPGNTLLVASVIDAAAIDPNPGLQGTVDWGDGTAPTTTTGPGGVFFGPASFPFGTFDVLAAHTYAAEGTFTITVTISDPATGATVSTVSTAHVSPQLRASGTIVNAAPGAPAPGNLLLVASVIDAKATDPNPGLQGTVDWGDGTAPTTTTGPGGVFFGPASFPFGTFDVLAAHTYAAEGTFTITVTISDPATGATVSTVSTAHVSPQLRASGTIVNAAPGAPAPGNLLLVASVIDAKATDPNPGLQGTVDWGDGTAPSTTTGPGGVFFGPTSSPFGTFDVLAAHTYAAEGTFIITVTISDPATGATVSTASTAHVSPQLRASGTIVNAAAGAPAPGNLLLVASVIDVKATDPNPGLAATIDWGDGTAPSSTGGPDGVFFGPAGFPFGTFDVLAAHTYATDGTFTITVTISDPATGATVSTASTAHVSPQLRASAAVVTAAPGVPVPPGPPHGFVVASVIDTNLLDSTGNLTATIAWGDGTPPATTGTSAGGVSTAFLPVSGAVGTFDLVSSHSYASAGTFTLAVTITDSAGSSTTATGAVHVTP